MRVNLLGDVAFVDDAGEVRGAPGAVPAAVLAHLALSDGRLMGFEELAARVWDVEPGNPRNALQAAVSRLRKVMGSGSVISAPSGYRLTPMSVDAREAERLLGSARSALSMGEFDDVLEASTSGLALFDEEPLAGLGSVASAVARASLEEVRRELVVMCGDASVLGGRPGDAVRLLSPLAAGRPLDEPVAACLLRALVASGRSAEALELHDRLRRRLATTLGVDPGPEVQEAYATALSGAPVEPVLRARLGVAAASRVVVVPSYRRRAVGRDEDVARLVRLMTTERAVTVTGLGGVGKSTLAAAVARAAESAWDGDVVVVALAGATSAEDVLDRVGRAWRLRTAALAVPGSLAHIVGGRTTLLVLDGCEGTPGAATAASSLLDAVPSLSVLATSRAPLGLEHEVVAPLEGLRGGSAEELLHICSTVHGAHAEDLDDVAAARLVAAVGGSPLGIEVIAAQVAESGAAQVLSSLAENLAGGPLDEVVVWARSRLSTDAESLLRHLALLPTGLDAQLAAGIVVGDARTALDELTGSGLARREAVGRTLWKSPEMVRLSVAASLTGAELAAVDRTCIEAFAALHRRLAYGWCFLDSLGPQLVAHRDDLESLLIRSQHRDADDAVLRCLLLLMAWDRHGAVAARRVTALVPAPGSDPVLAAWCRALTVARGLRFNELSAAAAASQELADHAALLGERALESWACAAHAHILLRLDRVYDALSLLDRAEVVADSGREAQVPEAVVSVEMAYEARRLRAGCLSQLGSPVADTEVLFHEALVLARIVGRPLDVLCDLATFTALEGSADVALVYVDEIVSLCGTAFVYERAHADVALAFLAVRRADGEGALRHVSDALRRFTLFWDLGWVAECFWIAAEAAALRDEWRRAAVLLGARRGILADGDPEALVAALTDRVRQAVGDGFDDLVAEGASLPTETATRLVIGDS